ncbi:hypothetical protein ACFL2B_01640 [Patescibacteria group bacterium]
MLYLSTKLIIAEAKKLGIKVEIVDRINNFIRLSKGNKSRLIKASQPPQNSVVSHIICCNKFYTKIFLDRAKLPTPKGNFYHSAAEALQNISKIRLPVAVKGTGGSGGENVIAGVESKAVLRKAIKDIAARCGSVIIEEMIQGDDYRVLVIDNKVIGCLKRFPARVFGDGRSTIKQLINKANKDPRRGTSFTKPLVKIEIDADTRAMLKKQRLTLASIPTAKKEILLKTRANQCQGGEVEDFTSRMHNDYKKMSIEAAQALADVKVVGIDFMTPDITQPLKKSRGVIIEANDAPMLQLHQLPTIGKPINVAKKFVQFVMK